jgi:hypothetical protein
MFVDSSGGAFAYTDGNFGSLGDIDGTVSLESVSCTSSGFCMAIDHDHKVFKYSGGTWDGGTTLTVPGTYTNFAQVSCVTTAFCVALASTSAGEVSYTWTGATWSLASAPFDAAGGNALSLTCTSTTFCLETSAAGDRSVFNGTLWSPANIDSGATPELYSSCVGTSCVAVDHNGNFLQSSDGLSWTSPVNIQSATGIGSVTSVACAAATLCVAGDGQGNATTYAVPPAPGPPALSGTPTVGQTLTLTHASIQTPNSWSGGDDWRRCDSPDAACTPSPISTSTGNYTLVGDDANKFIDVRETFGFGFYQQTVVSNVVGPIGGGGGGRDRTPPRVTLSGKSTQNVDKLELTVGANEGVVLSGAAVVSLPAVKRKLVRSNTAHAKLAAGRTVKLPFRFPRRALRLIKRALHHGSHLKAKITATATDAAGNASTATKTVKLDD